MNLGDTTRSPFGISLRQWRQTRGWSQLRLSSAAQTTSRHISFLETGRSRPTSEMVLRLSDALDIPLRDRNRLLTNAGLASCYPEESLDSVRYQPAFEALSRLLNGHSPYPGMILDGDSRVVLANSGADRLFGCELAGINLFEWFLQDPSSKLANWPGIAGSMVARLRREEQLRPGNEHIPSLIEFIENQIDDGKDKPVSLPIETSGDLVLCPWFLVEDEVVKTMALTAKFDQPVDVIMEELRIELFYPADDAAERYFLG